MYTYEITHKGQTHLVLIDADTEKDVLRHIASTSRNANSPTELVAGSIKRHDTPGKAHEYVAKYREALGKTPVPTAEELRANALKINAKPPEDLKTTDEIEAEEEGEDE